MGSVLNAPGKRLSGVHGHYLLTVAAVAGRYLHGRVAERDLFGGRLQPVQAAGIAGDEILQLVRGSVAFVPSVVGLIIAGEVVKDLCNVKGQR